MDSIKLLEEIRNDYVNKFDNDPLIKRACDVMINEYKARSKAFSLKSCCTDLCDVKDKLFICETETCMLRKCQKCGKIE